MVDSSKETFLKQLPDFRTYEDAPLTDLPFVTETSYWAPYDKDGRIANALDPSPTSFNYSDACQMGREHAAHLAQYLKDNPGPEHGGDGCVLAKIINEMLVDIANGGIGSLRKRTKNELSGFVDGFLSYLQRLIKAQAETFDIAEDAARRHEAYMEFRHHIKNETPSRGEKTGELIDGAGEIIDK